MAMFNIVFVLIIGVFIFFVISNITQWSKNNKSPRLTVAAELAEKDKKRHHHNNNGHQHTSTSYHLIFRVSSGDTMEFRVSKTDYNGIIEGDVGQLDFQGTRYLGFEV